MHGFNNYVKNQNDRDKNDDDSLNSEEEFKSYSTEDEEESERFSDEDNERSDSNFFIQEMVNVAQGSPSKHDEETEKIGGNHEVNDEVNFQQNVVTGKNFKKINESIGGSPDNKSPMGQAHSIPADDTLGSQIGEIEPISPKSAHDYPLDNQDILVGFSNGIGRRGGILSI
ncbi:hypothetical protein L2E82_22564 [Cichorium intybus]|uniref:Uncharacterized protein n=1 Tax=Cichorium intybus TaxID=13427 RepID=A0ACB9DY29_CICIN|nr:hypothetical protein L2E82_22564 [Cichorium intybus]